MKNTKTIFKFTLLTVLLLFFMYLAFKDVDFERLLLELSRTSYIYAIVGMLIGTFLGSYIRAWRWKYLLDPLKPNIKVYCLFPSVMIGYMMNALIPRGGEVARPVLTAQKEGISKASTFGTIVVERIIDMLTMFFVLDFVYSFLEKRYQ